MSSQRGFFGPGQRMGGGAARPAPAVQPAAPPPPPPPTAPAGPVRGPGNVARVTVDANREVSLPASAAITEGVGAPDDHQWPDFDRSKQNAFLQENPGLARQILELIAGLGNQSVPWSEVVSFSDWDLVEMGNMAMTMLMQGRFAQAEEALMALRDLSPHTPLFCLGLGDVLEEQGKFPQALEAFEECIRLSDSIAEGSPEATVSRIHRAAIRFKTDAPVECATELLAALRQDPEPGGERAALATMGLQSLFADDKLEPAQIGLEPGTDLGNGWRFEDGAFAYSGGGAAVEAKPGMAAGTRLFASSQLSPNLNQGAARFRADQTGVRVAMRFVNLARPLYKRVIARGVSTGTLPSAVAPAPDKARQRLLGVLGKRRYEEMRSIYHRVKNDLVKQNRLSREDNGRIAKSARRLYTELRNFYKQRAAAAQLDKSYRNAQTVEVRASRVRGANPNPPPAPPPAATT